MQFLSRSVKIVLNYKKTSKRTRFVFLLQRKVTITMIYITGDCHGNFERFNASIFPEQKEMTKEDFVIICGDFGGVWNREKESVTETMLLDWLECKPFTTLFVDGNHENFDRLYSYPVEEWCGGKIHRIRPSVIHLMRGQVFELCERKIFTFGGASSHDIDGGILELNDPEYTKKKRELDKSWTSYRINHMSWWKEELPSEAEMSEGLENLAKCGNEVDFIISHCCASSTAALFSHGLYKPDILTAYFEEIRQIAKFKKWFFGHYHDNRNVSAEEILLWEQIIRIA